MPQESWPDRRKRRVSHMPPPWVDDHATFFITINCQIRGTEQLTMEATSQAVFESAEYLRATGKWFPEIVLLMPDHLHAMAAFSWEVGSGMSAIIENWKRYLATHHGVSWQRDFFDHRIRNEEDHSEKWAYIRENPVKAGLVDSFEEWPHVWRPETGLGW